MDIERPGSVPSDAASTPDSGRPFDRIEARSGIDYALRTIQQSQVQFSLMADAKSNIMITVCSLVLSASLTQLHRSELLPPILVLDLFTLVALVAAILCVLPSNRRPESKEGRVDTTAASFNPLFFMHFQHLSPEQFVREIETRFSDTGTLYRSVLRDIYAAGTVLARSKYRYLRISYSAFLLGLLGGSATLAWSLATAQP